MWRSVEFEGLGVTADEAPALCPACAYHTDGRCVWCPDGATDIPECDGCIGRVRQKPPWYLSSEFLVPTISSVAATLIAAVILARVLKH